MSDDRYTTTFRLVDGAWFKLAMTIDELSDALRAIDNDGVIGRTEPDGQQVWYRCRHIVSVEYPEVAGVDWLEIRDQMATPDNPQEKRTGGA